jgi:hypothetical protein
MKPNLGATAKLCLKWERPGVEHERVLHVGKERLLRGIKVEAKVASHQRTRRHIHHIVDAQIVTHWHLTLSGVVIINVNHGIAMAAVHQVGNAQHATIVEQVELIGLLLIRFANECLGPNASHANTALSTALLNDSGSQDGVQAVGPAIAH